MKRYKLLTGFIIMGLICSLGFTKITNIPLQDILTQSLQCFFNSNEKVFLHVNRDVFVSGETMFFKAYLVQGAESKQDTLCKILYIELTDPQNKQILGLRSNVNKGYCSGLIGLPDTLKSGYYRINAYTSWMRNNDSKFFFTNKILIINQNDNNLDSLENEKFSVNDKFDIRFYPEGGQLVQNIENRIAYKVISHIEADEKINCRIVDDSVKEVTNFDLNSYGTGSFRFVPKPNTQYFALLNSKNIQNQSIALPVIKSEGIILNVERKSDNFLSVNIFSSYISEGVNSTFNLIINSKGKTIYQNKIFVTKNQPAKISFPRNNFLPGIAQITVFDINLKPVCERLIYIKPENKMVCNILTDKNIYSKREKVNLQIQLNSNDNNILASNLSVSVSEYHPMIDELNSNPNIGPYLSLHSDIPEFNSAKFNPDTIPEAVLDELLICNSWQKFKWNDIFYWDQNDNKYPRENKGFILSGRLIETDSTPVTETMVLLSTPDSLANLKYCMTDKKGRFYFLLNKYYDGRDLIIQIDRNSNKQENIKIEIDDFNHRKLINSHKEPIDFTIKNYLLNTKKVALVNKIYPGSSLRIETGKYKQQKFLNFFGYPDEIIRPSDFSELIDFEEISQNILPGVRFKKRSYGHSVHVIDVDGGHYWDNPSLVLINNIPVNDAGLLAPLGTNKIKSIEIKKKHLLYGDFELFGILSVFTIDKKIPYTQSTNDVLVIKNNVIDNLKEVTTPDYSYLEKNTNLPDFRQSLYWNPNVITDNDGKSNIGFYTSDLKTKYKIEVQGITAQGVPISASTIIEVK